MLFLSTKTNTKIVRTDERTDGRVVCKIVFSIFFNVGFRCSKASSRREDSFEHQKCRPASEMPFEWHFVGGPMWVRHSVLAGLTCHDLQSDR